MTDLGVSFDQVRSVTTGNRLLTPSEASAIAAAMGLSQVVTHSATGVQNYAQEVTGRLHVLESTVTAFDLTVGATLADNGVFAIYNGHSSDSEFDISANAVSFAGSGSVDPHAFEIGAGETVLFYVSGTSVYPLAGTGGAGGAATMGSHPVVLTRDTPSLTELNSIAQESVDDNSGLWVLASDQVLATENAVDSSIMIRALRSGLLDADGDAIPTTATQKNGGAGDAIRLSGGTIVRVFSSTDLRVVTAPGASPMEERFPDVPFSGAIRIEEDQGVYNSFLRRTATNAGPTTNQYIAMPDLHPTQRPSWVVPGDVFVMRHTGAPGSQRIAFRADNTGDSIATHGVIAWLDPGETLAIQAPARGIRTWQLFPVGQRSDDGTYYDPEMAGLPTDWYIDDVGAIAADNSARLHYQRAVVDGVVRDHIHTAGATNNPASLLFERRNIQDDIAWVNLFSTWGAAVPPLGTTVQEIEDNIAAALTYVQNNVGVGFDFELSDPDVIDAIQYVTFQSVQTVKVGLSVALASHINTLDVIRITGNSYAGNNGDWAITNIYPDRLAFDITIPASSAAHDTGASGTLSRPLYGRVVVKSDEIRQVNFDLYRNSARNNPVPSFETGWFDITTDPAPANSLLTIGYNTDVQTTESVFAMQADDGEFYSVLGGPRGSVHYLDNTGGNYQNTRYLPFNFEDVHIRTDGTCQFYFDLNPADLPTGRRLRYSIFSDRLNDDDDVTVRVGRPGALHTSDEGLQAFAIRNGVRQEIEIYNDGGNTGWRLVSPFSRRVPSAVDTAVVTPTAGPLTIDVTEIVALENEDPNRHFIGFNATDNRFILEGAFDYELEYSVRLRFDGSEDTGLSFVNCELVPTLTRGGSTTDIRTVTGAVAGSLFFVRNGNNSDDATKPIIALNARVRWQAQAGDEIGFDLRFGTFPAGYSLANLRRIERQYSAQVTGGIE